MAKSIQQVVNEILRQRHDLMPAIKLNLINGNELARQIKGRVERSVKTKVKLNTITVAIKRYQRRMAKTGNYTVDLEIDVSEFVTRIPLNFYVYENNQALSMYFSNLLSVADIKDKIVSLYMDVKYLYVAFTPDIASKIQASKGILVSAIEDVAWFGLRLNQEVDSLLIKKLSDFISASGIEVFGMHAGIKDIGYVINKKHLSKILESFS